MVSGLWWGRRSAGGLASFHPWVLVWVTTIRTVFRPEVRYARADDDVTIAYAVIGDGPVTMVVVSPLLSQLELAWEEPALEHFWSRLTVDVRPPLAGLRMPVLVIHRQGDQAVPPSDGRYLAEHIPGAQYAELPGNDHTVYLGDQRAVHSTVIAFLDGAVAGGALGAALRRADRKNAAGTGWDALTPAEREVAALIAAGMTNS